MPLGVVIERREIDNPWQSVSWRAVAVIPGAPEIDEARQLRNGPGWVQYHAATLALELHRSDTEGYKHNISDEGAPMVYVVLRFDDDEGDEDDDGVPNIVEDAGPNGGDGNNDESADSAQAHVASLPNAINGQYEDLVGSGIIDPALVARSALQNAASVAGLMLTTGVIVTELKDDDDPVEDAVA